MANNKEQKLFSEFPPVSTEQWEEVITADLKGADYQKKLIWKTAEGFNVRPYYRAEDLEGIRYLDAAPGEFPYVRGTGKCNDWKIHETIAVCDGKEANSLALKALMAGCESIGFHICAEDFGKDELDRLICGIYLDSCEVTFTGKGVKKIAETMLESAESYGLGKDNVRINFIIDPIIGKLSLRGKFECCEDGSKCFANLARLIEKASVYKGIRIVGVAGENFHNSGSTIVQELAFTLSAGHEYLVRLMEAGLTVDKAAGAMRFSMAVSANYFMEIAKFRAARMLWANIVKEYNPECECSEKMRIHAVTSKWNLSVYDPYVNMLRGTTESMSAAISGVYSLEVLPFNAAYEKPDEFSSRIARNVQLLLKHESHFDNVVDPAGGSYYIETLTKSIAEEAWKLFIETEDKGGYIAAFKSGFITGAIEESAAKKDMNIATRREILLGTNQYPNFTEEAGPAVSECDVNRDSCGCGCPDCKCGTGEKCDCGCGCDCDSATIKLRLYRGGMAFEELRLKVDHSGKNPKAFMLTAGTLSMARARSQFSCNFFGYAGIRVIDNTFFADIEEGVKQALASGAEIVVLCAADDDYAELGPKILKMLDGKAILVIAGAPACADELREKGIGNFINVKSNVLETLRYYVKELGI